MSEFMAIFNHYMPAQEHLIWAIFLFALGKSTIFLSSLLPPASVTLLLGVMVSHDIFPLALVGCAITLGAALGSILSFHFGRWCSNTALMKKIPLRYQRAVENAQTTLAQKGTIVLFSSRFLAVLRYTIPFAAGVIRLPLNRVYAICFISAALWSIGFLIVAHISLLF